MRRREKQFGNQGVLVVLVGLGTPDEAQIFAKEFDLSFPIVCDPQRRLYRAYGLKKTGLLSLASPSLLIKGIKALGQGRGAGLPTGDIYQLPGVFIIDTAGRIRFGYFSRDPADHPSPADILSAVKKMKNK